MLVDCTHSVPANEAALHGAHSVPCNAVNKTTHSYLLSPLLLPSFLHTHANCILACTHTHTHTHFIHSKGDLDGLGDHGSLHQYLLHLHDQGRCPVTSFWWAKTHVVSVCSPRAFEDTQKLYNRPSEWCEGTSVVLSHTVWLGSRPQPNLVIVS